MIHIEKHDIWEDGKLQPWELTLQLCPLVNAGSFPTCSAWPTCWSLGTTGLEEPGLDNSNQSLAHGEGTSLPPRVIKCLGLDLPLIRIKFWAPLLLLVAKIIPQCSPPVGLNSTGLMPLVDVGLLELTKLHP